MTTANKITITRILMIPAFVLAAVYYGQSVQRGHPLEWQRYLAIALFVIAAASDGIDGYVARRFNQRSRLGEILDPIADKGLLLAAILTLSFSQWSYSFPLWFPVLVIARDAVIVIGAIVLRWMVTDLRIRPTWTGKIATVTQMIAIACVMLQFNPARWSVQLGSWESVLEFLDLPVALAGFFTLISGIGYVIGGIRRLSESEHAHPPLP